MSETDSTESEEDLSKPEKRLGISTDNWPTPDEGALKDDVRTQYLARKRAISLYIDGASDATIRSSTGISFKYASRLARERCLKTHHDGQIYGWRGIIPHQRINSYKRKSKIRVDVFGCGAVGALTAVFDRYPDLRERFHKRILKAASETVLSEARRKKGSHWKWFLDELRKLGYDAAKEWPFNTQSCGYASICRYVDRVFAENPKVAARVLGGKELHRKMIAGDGVDRPVKELLHRVEMDSHKLDGRFCVMIPQLDGGWTPRVIHRLWVTVILETTSRAVLGYHLSMGKEVSKEDVLRTIKKSLSKWQRREISFSEAAYDDGAGLPPVLGERWLGLCWDEMSVDGAMAGKCDHVRQVLADVVACRLLTPDDSFSKRRSKDDRPFIESYFRQLGAAGFQRLTNTTGGKPSDKHGRDPDAIAVTSQFQLEYAQELLDVLIANYNAAPHTHLGGRSPLQYLEFALDRKRTPARYASPSAVQEILSFRKLCTVRGGLQGGRRPYVHFSNADYSSDLLARRHNLLGKKIWVANHLEDDGRVAMASLQSGESLGILRAAPPWHLLPHSLQVRPAVSHLVRKEKFRLQGGKDAIEEFIHYVEAQTGRKLPVHPAYLEARRILMDQAERSTGQSLLASAKRHPPVGNGPPTDAMQEDIVTSSADRESDSKVRRPLPALRMAAGD